MTDSKEDTMPQDHIVQFHEVKEGGKRGCYMFLTPRGGGTRLRIHASLMTREQAETVVAEINADPEHDGKYVAHAKHWDDGRRGRQ
jgi:hypothetical protein